ncbi:MAG TPA: protease modulator HflC [Fervidobacterium sp.]|jgi:membrane protease subunit HflC|nr:protease modulator HflC [Fervidobacterium sp.]MBP8657138.1 protease modulator HflC [Fervidobacterium sp.]MBP9518088.1 protease modulator HflC [Fervidobacterium sp.]NLH37069.1 protease modulator HflC [Thermotogaceae bacterium]HCL98821.1 protease modulator HflC [Fervidobacterium sp.]
MRIIGIATTVVLVVLFLSFSIVIVDETQYAVVIRFGEIVKVITKPGLAFKTPFVDTVTKLDKRYTIYDIPPERIITSDKKTLVIDSYIIWRISDPKRFIESMRSESLALSRLDDIVYSGLRNSLAKYDMDTIVTQEKDFLKEVLSFSASNVKTFGIEIVDVRIKKTDLPIENRNAVFERMKSERQSIAALIRAEGEKEAQRIRSEADKKALIIQSQAQSDAEQIKGTGEASATKIYSQAYSQDPQFYKLWKTLESYGDIIPGSVILLDEEMDILDYLK